jgi:hypothetical protein
MILSQSSGILEGVNSLSAPPRVMSGVRRADSLVADRPSDPPLGVACLHLLLKTQTQVSKYLMLDENWVGWVRIQAPAFASPAHENWKG